MLFRLCCNSILSCLETNFASSPLQPGRLWQYLPSKCLAVKSVKHFTLQWDSDGPLQPGAMAHALWTIHLEDRNTIIYIWHHSCSISPKSEIRTFIPTQTLLNTRAYVRLRSKYGIPEVTVTGRSCAEAERGRRMHHGGYKRGNRGLLLAVRPRSCWPPSDSQLIVCSTNTLEASRVTLIDERLEFK